MIIWPNARYTIISAFSRKAEENCIKCYKILGFHGGNYEERSLVEYGAMWVLLEQEFRRNVLPRSSGWKEPISSLILSILKMGLHVPPKHRS